MFSRSKFTDPSMYFNPPSIYKLQDYPIGCRLRNRPPQLDLINRYYYYPIYPCSFNYDNPNFHEICCCSYQYRLNCCQQSLPSLCHKLQSAPYTKYAPIKKKTHKTKETQTQKPISDQKKQEKSPIKQKQVSFQPIYKNPQPHPVQQIVYRTTPPVPNIPQNINLYQQPIPQQVIYQVPIAMNPPVPQTINPISFRTIPAQNTTHSIKNFPSKIFYPQNQNSQIQSVRLLSKGKIPNRTSLIVYDGNNTISKKEITEPLKEDKGVFIFPVGNQNKENVMAPKNEIINSNPQNSILALQQNYGNYNKGQVIMQKMGMQRNISVSQNQQIQQKTSSFSSSQSQMKSSIQRSTKTSQFQEKHQNLQIGMKKEDEESQNQSLSNTER